MKIKSEKKKNYENKNYKNFGKINSNLSYKNSMRMDFLKDETMRRDFLKDERANFSIIISSLLLVAFLMLSIILLNTAIEEREENREIITSDEFQYIMNDYIRNLPLIEQESLYELSEAVIKRRQPCLDSRSDLKEIIDERLSYKSQEYWDNYNIQINSSLIAIENETDPFSYKFKVYVSSAKGDYSFENIVSSDVDCIGLKDPVPLLCCKGYSGLETNQSSYNYGNSLSELLRAKGVENHSNYINASSPLIIRKCPYDPYRHHGDDGGAVMKNCRDNGYYHESRDGACYLCRLEGKCGCEHYGFETFINPQKTNETGLVSACGSDHVIFSDDVYPGVEVIYNNESNGFDGNVGEIYEILYLDPHGHKVKYGMSEY